MMVLTVKGLTHCTIIIILVVILQAGKVTRGVVTNVSSEGLLTLQLAGVGSAKLKELEQKINSLCNTVNTSSSMLYCYIIYVTTVCVLLLLCCLHCYYYHIIVIL